MTNCGILGLLLKMTILPRRPLVTIYDWEGNERFIFDAARSDLFNQEGLRYRGLRFSSDRTGTGSGPADRSLFERAGHSFWSALLVHWRASDTLELVSGRTDYTRLKEH